MRLVSRTRGGRVRVVVHHADFKEPEFVMPAQADIHGRPLHRLAVLPPGFPLSRE